MSYLSEAHNEWHTVNGKYAVCPLDCGVNEGLYDEGYEEPMISTCPTDGEQEVTKTSVTRGSDPYEVQHLACGHNVVWLEANDPLIIN